MYKNQISNEELEEKYNEDRPIVILDVREASEYSFGHVPGSVLIPLGQLEERCNELDPENEIFIICRSGNRSNVACHLLDEQGFKQVYNVIPGMIGWNGPIESSF